MRIANDLKESVLWQDAEEEFKNLPIKKQIEYHSKAMYPHERELTFEKRLDILMKLPNQEEILKSILTEREIEVINFLDEGLTYDDICVEIGYGSKASIVQVLNRIRKKIQEAL